MIQSLLLNVLAGIAGLWVAKEFIPGVSFQGPEYILLIAGAVLGILNTVAKPLLKLITLPLHILTFGISSLLINILLVWATEIGINLYYPAAFEIQTLIALFWTTIAVWGATILVSLLSRGRF